MRLPESFSTLSTAKAANAARYGPALIAVGLAVLIAAAWWSAAPVLTAMALVMLGATGAMIARFHGSAGSSWLLTAHLLVYGTLYFLLVGAAWHGPDPGSQPGWRSWQWIDLAASVGPLMLAIRWAVSEMRDASGSGDAPAQ